jgi:hypothetical protein
MAEATHRTLVIGVIGGRRWLTENRVELSVRNDDAGTLAPVTLPPPAPLDLLLFLALHPGSHKPALVKGALYRSVKDGHKSYDYARGSLRTCLATAALRGSTWCVI